VPLSSVDQNSKMIGKIAASLALKLAQSKTPARPKARLVAPQLVVRASSSRTIRKLEPDRVSPA
jgi:DNA-binding LacI/PurR family transcriptional regulator